MLLWRLCAVLYVCCRGTAVRVSRGWLWAPVHSELVLVNTHARTRRFTSVRLHLRALWSRVHGQFDADEARESSHWRQTVSLWRLSCCLLTVRQPATSSTTNSHHQRLPLPLIFNLSEKLPLVRNFFSEIQILPLKTPRFGHFRGTLKFWPPKSFS